MKQTNAQTKNIDKVEFNDLTLSLLGEGGVSFVSVSEQGGGRIWLTAINQ